MLSLNITGKTMTDINNTIASMAEEIGQPNYMGSQTVENPTAALTPVITTALPIKVAPVVKVTAGPTITEVINESRTVAPVAPPQGQTELDTDGIPWDKRIHSAGKSKNATGTWRVRRRLDKDVFDKVWAELKGQTTPAAPTVIPAAPTPTVAVAQPALLQPAMLQQVSESAVAPTVETPAYNNVPVPVGTKPAHSLATFTANLPLVLADLINTGKITKEYTAELCTHFGVDAIWEIASDADKCSNLFEFLVQNGLITEVG